MEFIYPCPCSNLNDLADKDYDHVCGVNNITQIPDAITNELSLASFVTIMEFNGKSDNISLTGSLPDNVETGEIKPVKCSHYFKKIATKMRRQNQINGML